MRRLIMLRICYNFRYFSVDILNSTFNHCRSESANCQQFLTNRVYTIAEKAFSQRYVVEGNGVRLSEPHLITYLDIYVQYLYRYDYTEGRKAIASWIPDMSVVDSRGEVDHGLRITVKMNNNFFHLFYTNNYVLTHFIVLLVTWRI